MTNFEVDVEKHDKSASIIDRKQGNVIPLFGLF
jgi:hypothetical protein